MSPLQHDADSLEAAILLAEQGVPITVYSLAMAGATAPLTLAGTTVQTNAEGLAAFAILQLAVPGCPLIYVGNAGIMDMRTSTYTSAGPEEILLNLALTEMGRHYGVSGAELRPEHRRQGALRAGRLRRRAPWPTPRCSPAPTC